MLVVVGRIGRAHGVRGDVAVDVRTDEPERRFAAGSSVVCGQRRLTVAASRHHAGRLLVTFEEIGDRTAAEALRGRLVEAEVDPDETPDEDDAFYDRQLIGLEVVTAAGAAVGTVTDVLHLPAHDTLVVEADGREVLVPFVEALVPEVDLAAARVVVTDLPGLLDPDSADVASPEKP